MVTGTDVDDTPTAGLTQWTSPWRRQVPSSWIGSGKQVGVGQVVGDVLAVACSSKGRTVILTMPIHPDGSLSGKWSRRTDRGTQGTETWTRS